MGRYVVVTVPLGVLAAGQINFEPPLPLRKMQSINRLGTANMNKVVLHFRTAFWGRSGNIGIASPTGQHGWIYNATAVCKAPVLVVFLVADAAEAAEKSSDSSVVLQCMRMLRNAFRPTHVPEPVGSFVTRWGSDPFARGAFSYFKVGSSRADCEALAEPLGWRRLNVGFAGEAMAVTNMGSVLVRSVEFVWLSQLLWPNVLCDDGRERGFRERPKRSEY